MKKRTRSRKRKGAKLGQHLLTSGAIAALVAEAAGIERGDRVLEIGPGTGILTRALLARAARVTAVEKDPGMLDALRENFSKEIGDEGLTLIEGDAREYPPDRVFSKGHYKIAANIPYYITGELLRAALSAKNKPQSLAFLIQKEVAERIARAKKESILSLSVKAYGTPRYVRTVKRGSFNPPPSVDSAILAVEGVSERNFKNVSEEDFFKAVKAGFAQKRKTLGGNLKRVYGEKALEALEKAGISPGERAEDVPLEKWLILANQLSALQTEN